LTLLLEIALVVLAGVAVAVCVALLPDARSTDRRHRVTPAPTRPVQLERLERLIVTSGASGAVHAHAYLRPLLVEIVSHRLAARGQALSSMPDAVGREVLGEQLWELVRPGRPFPEDRRGPGVSSAELDAMLERAEVL
jgi:hypothetical protein